VCCLTALSSQGYDTYTRSIVGWLMNSKRFGRKHWWCNRHIISKLLSGRTEENREEPQSWLPVCRARFELNTSQMKSWSVTRLHRSWNTTVAQQLNKFPSFYESWKFIVMFRKAPHLVLYSDRWISTIGQRWSRCWGRLRPSPTIYIQIDEYTPHRRPYFFKICFNNILSSTLKFSNGFLLSSFLT
jgi:hypothetical protein